MRSHSIKTAVRGTVLLAISLLLGGCFLRVILGGATTDDLGTFIDFIFDDVSAAYCRDLDGSSECMYNLVTEDGSADRTSTTELVSELGVFGLLIDPIILQVPDAVQSAAGTITDEAGTTHDLIVTQTDRFNVQPGTEVIPQGGQTFLIIEFPQAVLDQLPEDSAIGAPRFDINFGYRIAPPTLPEHRDLKVMFTGRVDVAGQTFFVPLLPCVADFALLPNITIPESSTPRNLIFEALNLALSGFYQGCNDQRYDFTNVTPPQPMQCDIDADQDIDRNDIRSIISDRNSPAIGTGDVRDADGDGTITILDGRTCVARCTRPRCAS